MALFVLFIAQRQQYLFDLKEMDQEKSRNEIISLQDRSRYSDYGSLTKLWVFESGDFEEEEAYILQTGFKDDHQVDLNYLIELGLSKNEPIIRPEIISKEYQGLEYEEFKDNQKVFQDQLLLNNKDQTFPGSRQQPEQPEDLSPKSQASLPVSPKKQNKHPNKNLLQFFFGAIISYFKILLKDGQLNSEAKEDWEHFLRDYFQERKERISNKIAKQNLSDQISSERLGRKTSTTNFSLADYTKLVRIKSLRKPLGSMFRGRYLWRKAMSSSLHAKASCMKKIRVLIKGFRQKALENLD